MRKAKDFKFSVLIERQACKPKNAKVGQEGVRRLIAGPANQKMLFIILVPLHISGMDKARDFKFGVRIQRPACNPKICLLYTSDAADE